MALLQIMLPKSLEIILDSFGSFSAHPLSLLQLINGISNIFYLNY